MAHTITLSEGDVMDLLREGELNFSGSGECRSGRNNEFTIYLEREDPAPKSVHGTPTER